MFESFVKDWSRWSTAERVAVRVVGLAALLLLASQLGKHWF